MTTLFITCGLQGAGKTTLARRLETEYSALRLTADDWLHDLHPGVFNADLDLHREPVEQVQWAVAVRVLELGCNVVLDWGVWSRAERDRYRVQARDLGVRVVLCVLDPPREELWRRLEQRREERTPRTFEITRAEFDHWAPHFEPPTPEELALYDPLEETARR